MARCGTFDWICSHMDRHLLRPEGLAILSGCTRTCSIALNDVRCSVNRTLSIISELHDSEGHPIRDLAVRLRNFILFWSDDERIDRCVRIWKVICDNFESYCACDKTTLLDFRYISDLHGIIGVDWVSCYCLLKDPRKPRPGIDYIWTDGAWLYERNFL